jgi:hypothetical protein
MTLRALLLVPLLAVAVDQARATLACGPNAETCLEAAGQGWLGPAGVALLVVYALALALGVAWLARGARSGPIRSALAARSAAGTRSGPGSRSPRPRARDGFVRLWLIGTAGVAAVCGGQALLAGALADPGLLGGGWLELLALCAAAGAVIALALRAAPAAVELVAALRPAAPRLRLAPIVLSGAPARPVRRPRAPLSSAAAGRAPPLTLG